MNFRWIIFSVIYIIAIVTANQQKNDQSTNSPTASTSDDYLYDYYWWEVADEDLKKEFGCPEEIWDLLKLNQRPVPNACLRKGYRVSDSPEGYKPTKVYNTFDYLKVLKVEEIEKTLTINIHQSMMWEDKRIKTQFKKFNGTIELRPHPIDVAYPIWTPSTPPLIYGLKEWKSLNSPIFFSELLFLSNNTLDTNTTLVKAILEWRVTVFCNFDFSNFPLDYHRCQFRMGSRGPEELKQILYDPDNTCHSMKHYEASSFDLTIEFVGNTPEQENVMKELGFDIKLNRQIKPYLFHYYLPSMLIVVVSFVSFIVPLSAIPGRIVLVVTQFLTLTNLFIHEMVGNMLICIKKCATKLLDN